MVVFYFDAKWRGTKEKVVLSLRGMEKALAEERKKPLTVFRKFLRF